MKAHTIQLAEVVIALQIQSLDNGEYLATSTVLKELVAQGRTMAETLEIAQDVARKLIESYRACGDPLPAAIQKQLKRRHKESFLHIPVLVPIS